MKVLRLEENNFDAIVNAATSLYSLGLVYFYDIYKLLFFKLKLFHASRTQFRCF